jgi:hypothetical protein
MVVIVHVSYRKISLENHYLKLIQHTAQVGNSAAASCRISAAVALTNCFGSSA